METLINVHANSWSDNLTLKLFILKTGQFILPDHSTFSPSKNFLLQDAAEEFIIRSTCGAEKFHVTSSQC